MPNTSVTLTGVSATATVAGSGGTFTRASLATYFDYTGTLQQVGNNVLRTVNYNPATGLLADAPYLEAAGTNGIRDPRWAGVTGTLPISVPSGGGAIDTNSFTFAGGTSTGVAESVVGRGTENGIPYIDFRFSGTATGASNTYLRVDRNSGGGGNNPTIAVGQTWTDSAFIRVSGGSTTNIDHLSFSIEEYNGSTLISSQSNQITAATLATTASSTLSANRFTVSRTVGSSSANAWGTYITLYWTGAGAVDITLRIGGFQNEYGSSATSLMMPSSGTGQYSRSADTGGSAILPMNTTSALAGASASFSAGTLTTSTGTNASFSLTGLSAAFSVGSLSVTITKVISGASSTASVGTLTPSVSASVSGVAASAGVGVVTSQVSAFITGALATSSAGTLTTRLQIPITGASSTSTAGLLTANVQSVVSGASSTSHTGSLSGEIDHAIAGVSATSTAQGVSGQDQFGIGGVSVGSAASGLSAEIDYAISGASATSNAGVVIPKLDVTIAGAAFSSTAGTSTGGVSTGIAGSTIALNAQALAGSIAVSLPSNSILATAGNPVSGGSADGAVNGGLVASNAQGLSVDIDKAISGVLASTASGVLIGNPSGNPLGASANWATGTLGIEIDKALIGNTITSAIGAMTGSASFSDTTNLSGNAISMAAGGLFARIGAGIGGGAIIVSTYFVAPKISVGLASAAANLDAGSLIDGFEFEQVAAISALIGTLSDAELLGLVGALVSANAGSFSFQSSTITDTTPDIVMLRDDILTAVLRKDAMSLQFIADSLTQTLRHDVLSVTLNQ